MVELGRAYAAPIAPEEALSFIRPAEEVASC